MAALALSTTGCGTEDPAPVVTEAAPAASQPPPPPACADVFIPGKVVDKAKASAGCMSPSGTIQAVGAHSCTDGTVLWQVDATTGAKAGYAREGKPYRVVKGDVAADRSYKKTYNACVSDQPAKARSENTVGIEAGKKSPAVAVEVTAGAGRAHVSVVTTTPATPTEPADPPAGEEQIPTPFPGGEWANAPKPTATVELTEDPV
ncbi:hypothetical protein AB0M02_00375 [Actinoplanes sp. NPDC051861]|uniref:hypothetical protein n=1 Tax=Actinoplanes sp. NPDC051861 TaxID=3155170 RepID=UPI00344AC6B9